MSSSPTTAEVIAELARVLRREGVGWYLFGAQAVIYWGRPRLSADVDVTVRWPIEAAAELARTLEAKGFRVRVDEPVTFVARTRVLPLEHRASGVPVDVVFGGPGLEDEFVARAVEVDLGGEKVPVMSPEDLVVVKILAGRPKDIEDVRGILAVRGESMDIDRARSLLALLDRSLGRSDLERELERLLPPG